MARHVIFALGLILAVVGMKAKRDTTWNYRFSLTTYPIELIEPLIRLQGEVRIATTHGLALQMAVGEVNEVSAWALAAQYSWYWLGDFEHGAQLGAYVGYANTSTFAKCDE